MKANIGNKQSDRMSCCGGGAAMAAKVGLAKMQR